jgi:hypothetical protein
LRRLVFALVVCQAACAAKTARISGYYSPTFDFSRVNSIAILPLRNAGIAPRESRLINGWLMDGLEQKNPNAMLMNPIEAMQALGDAGLADAVGAFVANYLSTGFLEPDLLTEIGETLAVDAVVQGELVTVHQEDGGGWGGHKGESRATIRFSMFACEFGELVWDVSSEGVRGNPSVWERAPPLIQPIILAMNKIVGSLPDYGR